MRPPVTGPRTSGGDRHPLPGFKKTFDTTTVYSYLGDNGSHDSGGGDGGASTLMLRAPWSTTPADVVVIAGSGGGGGGYGGGDGAVNQLNSGAGGGGGSYATRSTITTDAGATNTSTSSGSASGVMRIVFNLALTSRITAPSRRPDFGGMRGRLGLKQHGIDTEAA